MNEMNIIKYNLQPSSQVESALEQLVILGFKTLRDIRKPLPLATTVTSYYSYNT